MKIQLISDGDHSLLESDNVTITRLESPFSLDEFDVNVIDLSTPSLWYCSQGVLGNINQINDLSSIKKMVERKTNSYTIYLLPANETFHYCFSWDGHRQTYTKKKPLKDCLELITSIVSDAIPNGFQLTPVIYENTTTVVNQISYTASFYFETCYVPITKSDKSLKPTTISIFDKNYLTTLQVLETAEKFINFIETILPSSERSTAPEWVNEVRVLNDNELNETIELSQEKIDELNVKIEEAKKRLQENERIKSILYTNGDELVEVVFSILERMLSCDLSEFIDEKKEDFLIKKDSYTLIGEIKGVTSNVKSEHVSQVDVHYQGYIDKLSERGLNENVHQVLIMNPFRNKPLQEREPVHDIQIKLAERNECLIIETATLLRLYEKFVSGDVSVETCERLFTEKTGLLKESDF